MVLKTVSGTYKYSNICPVRERGRATEVREGGGREERREGEEREREGSLLTLSCFQESAMWRQNGQSHPVSAIPVSAIPDLCPWASYSSPLTLSFPIWKTGRP